MKSAVKVCVGLAFVALLAVHTFAQEKKPQYVGVAKCRPCHMLPAKGNQYKVWQEGPHSKAIETLKNRNELVVTEYYVCEVCGNTVEASAPEICPICGAKKIKFKKID